MLLRSRLLDHFQTRPAAWTRWLIIRWWHVVFNVQIFIVVHGRLQIEDHALTVFTGVNTHDCSDGNVQAVWNTTEATFEAHCIVVHVQVTHGTRRDVEDDLPVIGKTLRDLHRRVFGVD